MDDRADDEREPGAPEPFDEAAFYALFDGPVPSVRDEDLAPFAGFGGFSDDVDDDLDGDADDHRAPLLPLDDRLWRHPSELARAGAPSRPPARRRRVMRTRDKWGPVLLAGAVGGLLCAGVVAAADVGGRGDAEVLARSTTTVRLRAEPVSSSTNAPSAADMAEAVQRSVVSLVVADGGTVRRGSAVIVLDGTTALTAAHLLGGETSKVAMVVDGTERTAKVLGKDPSADLALVSFSGAPAEAVVWGDLADLRAGQPAVAVAAGLGRGPAVSTGAIRSLSRSATMGGVDVHGLLELESWAAADSAGGALLDARGHVVGVTLAGATDAEGFTYAIPADQAADIARQLAATGRAVHPWLGIEGVDRGVPTGVVVRAVRASSPAARTGIAAGDVITSIDSSMVIDMDGLLTTIRSHRVGDTVVLTVWRGDVSRLVTLTLTDH